MVRFENIRRFLEVEVFHASGIPGQLGDGFQVVPDDLRLHGLAADPVQPAQLTFHLLARLGSQLQRGQLLTELFELVGLALFAQLLADLFHLLTEEHFSLALAQFLLDLRLDVLLRIEHRDLSLHQYQHPAEPLLDRQRLEERLSLRGGNVDVACHQIGKPARIAHAVQHLLNHFFGETGLLSQLRGPLPHLAVEPDERRVFRGERGHFVRLADDRLHVSVLFGYVHCDGAPLTVQQELHSGQPALELPHLGDGADRVETVGGNLLGVLALANREDEMLGRGQRSFYGSYRPRSASADRGRDAREQHHVAQWEDREGQSFTHLWNALSCYRDVPWPVRHTERPENVGEGAWSMP